MATSTPELPMTETPELLSAAQLSREAKVSIGLVNDRLMTGEIRPDFRSGRTLLFDSAKLPQLRAVLRRRY